MSEPAAFETESARCQALLSYLSKSTHHESFQVNIPWKSCRQRPLIQYMLCLALSARCYQLPGPDSITVIGVMGSRTPGTLPTIIWACLAIDAHFSAFPIPSQFPLWRMNRLLQFFRPCGLSAKFDLFHVRWKPGVCIVCYVRYHSRRFCHWSTTYAVCTIEGPSLVLTSKQEITRINIRTPAHTSTQRNVPQHRWSEQRYLMWKRKIVTLHWREDFAKVSPGHMQISDPVQVSSDQASSFFGWYKYRAFRPFFFNELQLCEYHQRHPQYWNTC